MKGIDVEESGQWVCYRLMTAGQTRVRRRDRSTNQDRAEVARCGEGIIEGNGQYVPWEDEEEAAAAGGGRAGGGS